MARIRTIKPEFWTSEQVVECSPSARLLFIGIWTFCDDNGIHSASAKRLKMEIFPADTLTEQEVQALVDELLGGGLLKHYTVDGNGYWQVTGWHKHQKIDRPTFRHPLHEGEQKGETPSPRLALGETSSSNHLRNGMESNGNNMSSMSDALVVLEYLNEKTNRKYRPVPANLNLISSRLKEGASIDDCKAVIDDKVNKWFCDVKMRQYLRPSTLFNATKFAQYVGELSSQPVSQDWE